MSILPYKLLVFCTCTDCMSSLSPSQIKAMEVLVGAIQVSGKTKWDMLDSTVKRVLKVNIVTIQACSVI